MSENFFPDEKAEIINKAKQGYSDESLNTIAERIINSRNKNLEKLVTTSDQGDIKTCDLKLDKEPSWREKYNTQMDSYLKNGTPGRFL